jgi:hypothetical protein
MPDPIRLALSGKKTRRGVEMVEAVKASEREIRKEVYSHHALVVN